MFPVGEDVQKAAFTAKDETGILVNSDFLNGKTVKDAIPAMIEWLGEKGIGHAKVQYKLRDWVFSRQRYWGEPIPIVKCDKCGYVALPRISCRLSCRSNQLRADDNGSLRWRT